MMHRAIPLRHSLAHSSTSRLITTSAVLRNAASSSAAVPAPKKPIGGFRGGVIGFLFGFSVASSFAAYHLLDEYRLASAALQTSVEELRLSTEKVSQHVRRIEAVEKDLRALRDTTVSKEDLIRIRTEMKKLYEGLHVEFLDLRAHVWGIQQDLNKVLKEESTTVRI
ncbi:hypothetical protein JOM56_010579 [Amanita muscaria]|uniref:IncA domain-containing protein n=1 Tax=Amanita muscaria (strain Koide BX008) TaxID=946122 RepID=A0A0C2TL42_AMAMK|nr:hypothetical protein M378DRAFT_159012 [Amanita muscaria Koide BX008]